MTAQPPPTPPPEVGVPRGIHRAGTIGWSIARLLLNAFVVAFFVVTVVFFLTHVIPGDPARAVLGRNVSQASVESLRAKLHLNESIPAQYWRFLSELSHGSLGQSFKVSNDSVSSLVGSSLEPTIALILLTMLVSIPLGVVIGLRAGTTESRAIDFSLRLGNVVALAMPPFFLGSLLILVLTLKLGIAPAGGWSTQFPEQLRYLWLPVIALSALVTPLLARAVRQRAKVVMRSPYIEAALARGISRRRIILRHVLPNSALPAITLIGLNAALLISGTVVVETLLGLPGLGSLLLNAVQVRNYPVVQGVTVVAGLFVVFCNFVADAAVKAVDPRTRN